MDHKETEFFINNPLQTLTSPRDSVDLTILMKEKYLQILFNTPKDNPVDLVYPLFSLAEATELATSLAAVLAQGPFSFVLDAARNWAGNTLDIEKEETHTFFHKNQMASGGSFFTKQKIMLRPTSKGMMHIHVNLESPLHTFSTDQLHVISFILKSVILFCERNKVAGFEFELQNIWTHPVDYQPYEFAVAIDRFLKKYLDE